MRHPIVLSDLDFEVNLLKYNFCIITLRKGQCLYEYHQIYLTAYFDIVSVNLLRFISA